MGLSRHPIADLFCNAQIVIFLTYTLAAWLLLSKGQRALTAESSAVPDLPSQMLSWPAVCVLWGLAGVEVYSLIHPFLLGDRLPFLPLMMTSVYCAAGLLWGWFCLGWSLLPSVSAGVGPSARAKREAKSPREGKAKKQRQ